MMGPFSRRKPRTCKAPPGNEEYDVTYIPPDPRDEVEHEMRDAIEFHIDGLRQEGESIPPPRAYSIHVDIGV